jgi:hypothetical protein
VLAEQKIAYVPFFPLDGLNPLQSAVTARVVARLNVGRIGLVATKIARHPVYFGYVVS